MLIWLAALASAALKALASIAALTALEASAALKVLIRLADFKNLNHKPKRVQMILKMFFPPDVSDYQHICVCFFQNVDEGTTGALNGKAPPVLDCSAREFNDAADGHHGNDSSNHGPSTTNIPRGESFVSPAMYV